MRGILGSSAFIVSQYDFQRRTKVVRVSEWVSAGLLSVVLVGQDARVQVEEKLFPSSLRFTDPFLLLVLEPGEQAVGVLSFCHAALLAFLFFLCGVFCPWPSVGLLQDHSFSSYFHMRLPKLLFLVPQVRLHV